MLDGNKLLRTECLQLTSGVVTRFARNTHAMTKCHKIIFRSPLSVTQLYADTGYVQNVCSVLLQQCSINTETQWDSHPIHLNN